MVVVGGGARLWFVIGCYCCLLVVSLSFYCWLLLLVVVVGWYCLSFLWLLSIVGCYCL